MIRTRSYHGMIFDICPAESNKIAYIILPDNIQEDLSKWLQNSSLRYACSLVCIRGIDWNNDLSPWVADGISRKDPPFKGHSSIFLRNFLNDQMKSIEDELKLSCPERTLAGVSLSGLFALWTAFNTEAFSNIISISGSFWYEGFASWVQSSELKANVKNIFISLGDKEKKHRDPRFASVQEATDNIVMALKEKNCRLEYIIEKSITHYSSLIPRLSKGFEFIYGASEEERQEEAQ